jgi:hypothetical protein
MADNHWRRFLETDVGTILVPGVLDVVAETVPSLPLSLVEFFLFHIVLALKVPLKITGR